MDARCSPATISKRAYVITSATLASGLIVPLQCLLKQQRLYPYQVTGAWNPQTTTALVAFQRHVGNTARGYASPGDWISLLVAGNSRSLLRRGAWGPDVVRIQRAMNATGAGLRVTGHYNLATRRTVRAYQHRVGVSATGIVGWYTWNALRTGRR